MLEIYCKVTVLLYLHTKIHIKPVVKFDPSRPQKLNLLELLYLISLSVLPSLLSLCWVLNMKEACSEYLLPDCNIAVECMKTWRQVCGWIQLPELPSLSHSAAHSKCWRSARNVSPSSFNQFVWPTWHPSQAKLDVIFWHEPLAFWSLLQMNNLVHLLAFWMSYLQVMQVKKSICFDMQMAASAHAALVTLQ